MYEKIIKLATIGETPASISARLGLTQDVLRRHYHEALQIGYRINNGVCKSSTDYAKKTKLLARAGDPEAIAAIKKKREREKVWRRENKAKVSEYHKRHREKLKIRAELGDPKAIETLQKQKEYNRQLRRQKKARNNASKQETTP